MADTYTLRPYRAGMGPAFRIIADAEGYTVDLLPVSANALAARLVEGTGYPNRQGHELPYDEPQTIGMLLHFIIAAHPRSGSGISADNRWPAYGWVSWAAVKLAAPHLDVLTMEADDLEAGNINPDEEA